MSKQNIDAKTEEKLFPLNDICENAYELFGYRKEVVIAALTGNRKETYTVKEVKSAIDRFLRKGVK